ncbi:MAG: UPF0182 family protein [Chthonomonadales bacterium]|nr:UPF0182 family protein [Chthonomonadales bacterium]
MARLPVAQEQPSAWARVARVVLAVVVLLVVLFGYQTIRLYTDWLWFRELGRASVFSGIVGARLLLFLGFGALFFVICYFNLWLAARLGAGRARPRFVDSEREEMSAAARKAARLAAVAGAVVLAFLVGGNAATHWPDYLLFTRAGRFGQTDPVFGADIGFFVFRLPFLSYLQGWFVFAAICAAIGAALIHFSEGAVDFIAGSVPTFAQYVRRHILVLLGFIALFAAWGHWLGRYEILFRDNGAFFGAGYTDVHARLPGAYVQTALMLLVAVLCWVNVRAGRAFRLPALGLALWAVGSLLVVAVYPGFVQRFRVVPNQFNAERPYITRDIEMTRRAYGLDRVREVPAKDAGALTAADLRSNQATIGNVRLWDWPQLGAVYEAKQALWPYYRFRLPGSATTNGGDFNLDVDRYHLNGDYRQVMLGARELYTEGLPPQAQTWVNLRLQYTHGYGVVMSPVNRVRSDGLPDYFLGEIPIRSTQPDLKVARPEIYYGELTTDYVFVHTRQDEFDYPSADGNQRTRYAGAGGAPLSGALARLAWSVRLGDTNMLLSSDLTSGSRIMFRRNIRERVQTLAPFLNWDNDPYLVVDGGRLVWMLDAYTVTDRYPYSRPFSAGTGYAQVEQTFNYIRNSVKAVVDAYDGTVTLYVADPADPLVKAWSRIFPSLFTPISRMSDSLRAHLRYPEDLFRIQRDIYTVYHITDPSVYYGKQDQWAVPMDPTPTAEDLGPARRMMPYYVVMRLPGEASEEFLMMTPFTPLGNKNMAAWMCAKCDPQDYGQLLVYRFPKGSNVNGPQQIMSQVNAEEVISKSVSLLNTEGSRVIWGNLLVIPVEQSLLYVVPLYVQAASAGSQIIPEIKQVIVASDDQVVMRQTLDRAIADLGSGSSMAAAGGQGAVGGVEAHSPEEAGSTPALPAGSQAELVDRAAAAYQRARQKEREYRSALDDLGRILGELQRSAAGPGG